LKDHQKIKNWYILTQQCYNILDVIKLKIVNQAAGGVGILNMLEYYGNIQFLVKLCVHVKVQQILIVFLLLIYKNAQIKLIT